MNKTLYVVASGLTALLIAGAPVAFAHDKGDLGAGFNLGLHLGQVLHQDKEHPGVNREDRDNDNDRENDQDNEKDEHAGARAALASHVAAGTVTSVNGSVFTLTPFGGNSTTTVTTDGTTVFKAKGGATTSAAVAVGSKVIVVGTTTATSSTGVSFTASIVKIIGEGLGHLRFWLGLEH